MCIYILFTRNKWKFCFRANLDQDQHHTEGLNPHFLGQQPQIEMEANKAGVVFMLSCQQDPEVRMMMMMIVSGEKCYHVAVKGEVCHAKFADFWSKLGKNLN